MKKTFLILIILILSVTTFCQTKLDTSKFNLDFEKIEKWQPLNWTNFGNSTYILSIDSIIKKSGKYSATIEYNGKSSDFKALAFTIPANFKGKKITITGYIKTENVSEGWAGLWMRIDPSVAFDNMYDRGIKGTTDWTKYEITLNLKSNKTNKIVIGALLSGKGKMWVDNLQVSIDGKDIKYLDTIARKEIKKVVQQVDTNRVKFFLPNPSTKGVMTINEALLKRRSVREYKDTSLTLQEVSQILWAAYGISDTVTYPGFGLHTAPSAGGLYPLELYLVVGNVVGLQAGIYRYHPNGHYLTPVKSGDLRSNMCDAAYQQEMVKLAPASIVYSAVFERNTVKYGKRGRERYVCMDLGHSGENVYLQATALGIGTCAIGAFTDKELSKVVGMPEVEEPLYIMPLGKLKD